MARKCPVRVCDAEIPSRLLMCGEHWDTVPSDLQREVYASYRNGQERDRSKISRRYIRAMAAALKAANQAA